MKLTNKGIKRIAQSLLFEEFGTQPEPGHIRYGTFDRPIESDPTDLPLDADPVAGLGDLLDLPPVEDPEYVPMSVSELKLALYALACDVPDGDVQKVFIEFRDKVNQMSQDQIRNSINEDFSYLEDLEYDGDDDDDDLDDYERGAAVQFEAIPEDEGMTLEDLAVILGYSSAGGVKGYLERVLQRMQYLIARIPKNDLQELKKSAAESYVLELHENGLIDDEDVQDLMGSLDYVIETPGYRYWLNNAYIMPAFRALEKKAVTRIDKKLESLDLPSKVHASVLDTVVSQAMGYSEYKPHLVRKRFDKAMDTEKAREVYDKYLKLTGILSQEAELEKSMTPTAIEMFDSYSKSKRAKLLKKSLEEIGTEP